METKIFFQNSKGNKLCGILSRPNLHKDRIVILVHGFSSNKNTKSWVLLKNLLDKEGITSLRIDLFAHGESEGNFEDLTTSQAVNDILSAIQYAKKDGYKKIGLVGSSFGGLASIMAASQSSDLSLLALKSPVSSYEEIWVHKKNPELITEWKNNGIREFEDENGNYTLKYDFFDDIKNNQAHKVASNIKVPTLIVHGDSDTVVPVEQSIILSKIIPQCQLILVKSADHIYQDGHEMNQLVDSLNNFIVQNI
jgi:pimeloyl-ACP methyl ester carboxylesterase